MGTGLLIARASRGLAISVHAVQKLLGRLDGEGLKGTGGSLGFWPGVLFVLAAGLGEAGSGLLAAAGFLGAVGPALIILVMLVAIFTVHWRPGPFAAPYGIEWPLLYLTAALRLAVAGPGRYSLDALLGLETGLPPERAGGDRGGGRSGVRVPRAAPGGADTSPDICLMTRGSGTS
jgi:putative oxidoreductase